MSWYIKYYKKGKYWVSVDQEFMEELKSKGYKGITFYKWNGENFTDDTYIRFDDKEELLLFSLTYNILPHHIENSPPQYIVVGG